MADFDPDAYLSAPKDSGFDPDAYLNAKPSSQESPAVQPENAGLSSYIPSAISDVPSEIAGAAKSAATSAAGALNPFSEERHAAYARQAAAPSFGAGMVEGIKQLGTTGSGLADIPAIAGAPITGAARSLIGHPYSAMTGIPYEEAKSDIDTALMGLAPGRGGFKSPAPVAKAPPIPSTEELFEAGHQGYQNAKGYGVEIHKAPVENLANTILSDLHNDGFRPLPGNAQRTFSALDELKNVDGQHVTVSDVDAVRRVLNRAGANPLEGSEREASRRAISAIDDYMATLDPKDVAVNPHFANRVSDELDNARANWAAGKRSELIEGKAERADLNAAGSGSGANINNAIRQQIKQILTNPKQQRGFSPDELDQMRRIVKGTWTGNVTRLIGKLAPHGIVSGGISGGLGYHLLGIPGMATAWGVGEAAKIASDISTKRQLGKLQNMVRSRAPIAAPTATPTPPPAPLSTKALLPYLGVAMPHSNNEPTYQLQRRGGAIKRALRIASRKS